MTEENLPSSGILNDQQIADLFAGKQLASERPLDDDQIQPASLDLRLGKVAWRVRASFLPGKDHIVQDKLDRFSLHQIDLTQGAVLETGCVYIVPLLESFDLPEATSASANPIGMLPAEVFPNRSTLLTIFSGGIPKASPAAAMIRALAW